MFVAVFIFLHCRVAVIPEPFRMPRRACREQTFFERKYPHGRVKSHRFY